MTLSADLRELAHPRTGLARGFDDAQATLNAAADELDRLRDLIDRLIPPHDPDQLGGCVWCKGSTRFDPKHDPDCPWVEALSK